MIEAGRLPAHSAVRFVAKLMRRWLTEARSDRRQVLKSALLASLPVSMLIISPERPLLSYVLAPGWLVAGMLLSTRSRRDRVLLIYVGLAVATMIIQVVRTYLDGSLTADQKSYGFFKAEYFVAAILPLGAGVALMVDRAADVKPVVLTLIVIGTLLLVPSLLFRDTTVLGEGRYTWQGILMALAGVLLVQFWLIRNVPVVTAIVVLCLVGVALTLSRQALVAAVASLLFTTVYWLSTRQRYATEGLRRRWLVPLGIMVALTTGMASLVVLSVLQARGTSPLPWIPDVSNCYCALGRYRELIFFHSEALYGGDHSRIRLLETAWQLFLANPIAGNGLGSLDGLVRGLQDDQSWVTYRYPHNLWLELAAEIGLPGLLVLVGPLVYGFVLLWRKGIRNQSPAAGSLLCIVCIFAVVASLSGDLPAARTLWMFGIPCLTLGVTWSGDAGTTTPRPRGRVQSTG